MPGDECQILRTCRIVRCETCEPIRIRGIITTALQQVMRIELIFGNKAGAGFIRDIEQTRPTPGTSPIDFRRHQHIGLLEQLDSAVRSGAGPWNPVFRWGKETDLWIWNPIGK